MCIPTILHPTDFSEESRAAFRLACVLARAKGAHLVILHVAPPPEAGSNHSFTPLWYEHGADRLWKDLYHLDPPDRSLDVEYRLTTGAPAAEILRLARQISCSLIVMGTGGNDSPGRPAKESVSAQVTREAICPVRLTKSPAEDPLTTPEAVGFRASSSADRPAVCG